MRADSRRHHPRGAARAIGPSVLGLVLLACGSSAEHGRPVTNPLDETAASSATPAAAGRAAGPPSSSAPGSATEGEGAAGLAIELMAEWLGVARTGLHVLAVQAVEWPNACLGIEWPGRACAGATVPGWEVLLLDALDGAHSVHLGRSGEAQWAGEVQAAGVVASLEADAVTLEVNGAPLELRLAPGTAQWRSSRGGAVLEVGRRVHVAYDRAPRPPEGHVAAWIVLEN